MQHSQVRQRKGTKTGIANAVLAVLALTVPIAVAGCADEPQGASEAMQAGQSGQAGARAGRVGCRVDLGGMDAAYIDQPRVMVRDGARSHIVQVSDEEFERLMGARFTKFYEAESSTMQQVQEVIGPLDDFEQAVAQAETAAGRDGVDVSELDEIRATALAKAPAAQGQRANVFTAKLRFQSPTDDDFPADQLGLFALRTIQAGEFVGMYVGELRCSPPGELAAPPLNKTERAYGMAIQQHSPSGATSEASTMKCEVLGHQVRNEMAHINHSYLPNLAPATVVIRGVLYWAFFATRVIRPFEQLTFDYGWQYFHGKTPWELDAATPWPVDG